MEPIESSETSAYINTLTPGTYPKEKKLEFWLPEQVNIHVVQKTTTNTDLHTSCIADICRHKIAPHNTDSLFHPRSI